MWNANHDTNPLNSDQFMKQRNQKWNICLWKEIWTGKDKPESSALQPTALSRYLVWQMNWPLPVLQGKKSQLLKWEPFLCCAHTLMIMIHLLNRVYYEYSKSFQCLTCGLMNIGGGKKVERTTNINSREICWVSLQLHLLQDLEKQTNKNMGMFVLPMKLLRNIQV